MSGDSKSLVCNGYNVKCMNIRGRRSRLSGKEEMRRKVRGGKEEVYLKVSFLLENFTLKRKFIRKAHLKKKHICPHRANSALWAKKGGHVT